MNKTTIVDISDLKLSYDNGESYILQDISFSLKQWEILSIIGKNGSGKSSLLKAIAGIDTPHAWTIKKNTENIAYVPQKIHLEKSFPLQVKEFLTIFNKSVTQKEIYESCKLFHTQNLLNKSIHVISGWEFQKILIINALLSKPDLLLLDEPTSGIDIVWEEQFYENITLVRKIYPKIAIILVSHNLHLVYKNSSQVVCLHENNLCCHGNPKEVLKNKEVTDIFWEYLLPYSHSPHNRHNH